MCLVVYIIPIPACTLYKDVNVKQPRTIGSFIVLYRGIFSRSPEGSLSLYQVSLKRKEDFKQFKGLKDFLKGFVQVLFKEYV